MPSKQYNEERLVQVYMEPEVKKALKDRAKKESRTDSAMAAMLLSNSLLPAKK